MGYYHSSSEYSWSYIGVILILCVILFAINGCVDSNKWNDGICSYCGGHYAFVQAVGHRYSTDYLYKCDKCGHIIEIGHYYEENKYATELGRTSVDDQ